METPENTLRKKCVVKIATEGGYEFTDSPITRVVEVMNEHARNALDEVAKRYRTLNYNLMSGKESFKSIDEIIIELKSELK